MKRILSEAKRTNRKCEMDYESANRGGDSKNEEFRKMRMRFWAKDMDLQDALAERLSKSDRLSLPEVRSAFLSYYRAFCKALKETLDRVKQTGTSDPKGRS